MHTIDRPRRDGSAAVPAGIVAIPALGRRRTPWRAILALVVVAALLATSLIIVRARTAAAVSYASTPVVRQTLTASVTATGTVNPQNTIAVGTQESGTISELDVDFNSRVKKGQVLARLDPTSLQAALDQAKAALAQSQAQAQAAAAGAQGAQSGVGSASAAERAAQATAQAAASTAAMNRAAVAAAQANVAKSQSARDVAQQTVNRDDGLIAQGYIAQSQLDADRSNLVAAQSALRSSHVAVQQAILQAAASASQAAAGTAQVAAGAYQTSSAQAQAQNQAAAAAASDAAIGMQAAQVRTAQTNLQRAVITSPVDGTVVARDVSVGQTVAASLQTPTLFSIAQDLRKMEVDVAVGEPDIGNVKSGENVDFTVLAYPNRTFHGTVAQVRINPTTAQNVVTYTTVVLVNNTDGALLPGMTANASIDTAQARNALVVPVAALSYAPAAGGTGTHPRRGTASSDSAAAGSASPWGATSGVAGATAAPGSRSRIFVQRDGKLVRVPVTVVLQSGTQAAVMSQGEAALAAGDLAVTSDSRSAAAASSGGAAAQTRNPLTGGTPGGAGSMRGLR